MEDDIIWTSVGLTQQHLDYLKKIHENKSLALRTILNSIINGEEQTQRKQRLNNTLNHMTTGILFLLISYLFNDPQPRLVSILIGTLFLTYGSIGGIFDAIRTTRHL